MKRFVSIVFLLLIAVCLYGCGSSSDEEIIEQLPDTITSYMCDGELYYQEVKEFNVIKRNTEKDTDYIECEITLEDEYFERVVHTDIYLTNYNEGWLIDSCEPYGDDIVIPLQGPGTAKVEEKLSYYEFESFSFESEDVEFLSDGSYAANYSIDESHKYADFEGTAIYMAELCVESATISEVTHLYWEASLDLEDVNVDWKVDGKWQQTEDDDRYPEYYTINIKSVDNDGNISADSKYYWPIYDWDINDLSGEYHEEKLEEISVETGENSPAYAELNINARYTGNQGSFNFKADEIVPIGNDFILEKK